MLAPDFAHAKVVEGSVAPNFTGVDFDGKPFDLNTYYKKKPIVISFFSVRCVSCLTVVKLLEEYRTKHNVKDEFVNIYVSLDDWKKEAHVPKIWKVVLSKNQLRLNDPKRKIGKLYNVDILPVTVVIGTDGNILWRRDDYNLDFYEEMTNKLDPLLKK
jgi:cytochrome oxidase Cu insertion factor (SCO1/SenC/PrrC family)